MRLIHTTELRLYEVNTERTNGYAILSHTWSTDVRDREVSYHDLQNRRNLNGQGWEKIQACCKLAREDDLEWAWIDTCCIDTTNDAELRAAINSMFSFYENAKVCYAFLSDLEPRAEIHLNNCRWFTRGWTLQELLAPVRVEFYDRAMNHIGSRSTLADSISAITKIGKGFLKREGKMNLDNASVAQRMSWASERETTEPEDAAYSLIGLFDVSMFLNYGEGVHKAFLRLQQEILKKTSDESLFAWTSASGSSCDRRGMLADSLEDFQNCQCIVRTGLLQQRPASRWIPDGLEFHYIPESVVSFFARIGLGGSLRKELWARLDCKDETGKSLMIHLQRDAVGAARTYYRIDTASRYYNEHYNWKSVSGNFSWEFTPIQVAQKKDRNTLRSYASGTNAVEATQKIGSRASGLTKAIAAAMLPKKLRKRLLPAKYHYPGYN